MGIQTPRGGNESKRADALKSAISQIETAYGKGSIMQLGSDTRLDVEGITTGCISLDLALGGKGIPRGRVVEVFGPEGSGKSTLCLRFRRSRRAGGTGDGIHGRTD